MPKQVTESFTLSNAWKNMLTQAKADGYVGSGIVKELTILNFNETVAYVHAHTTGATNPSTASDGLPIGTDSSTAPSPSFSLPEGTDLAAIWVHTAGTQTIKYLVIG